MVYAEMEFSVIPCRKDKKPFVAWTKYQTERAGYDQIKAWWSKWPDANPAIVTGEISGIDVLDADSETGKAAVDEFLPDSLLIPTVRTPKGYHFYFRYSPGLQNGTRIISDCDLRTSGGYILAPPGYNEAGQYRWIKGLKITDIDPPKMPEMLFEVLKNGGLSSERSSASNIYNDNILTRGDYKATENGGDHNRLQVTTGDFKKGTRDNDLFHLANALFKGGMVEETIRKYLLFYASHCEPSFLEREVLAKIESAKKRVLGTENNISEEVRDFVVTSSGYFLTTDCFNRLQVTTRPGKKAVVAELLRLYKKGVIERHGKKNGCYRKIEGECEAMDFLNAEVDPVELWLPFNLQRMATTMPGNIILIAGEPNAGKTAFLLNVIRNNMHKFDIHYFNSEMGPAELKKRLAKFDDITLDDWTFKAWERAENFSDVVKPGIGKINIIDFLEIYDAFYEIGGRIAEIHKKLNGAVAIIALQKNRGVDTGLGGFRSIEKPRLALAMEPGLIKVVKAKNWAGTSNPNKKQTRFKLANGCNLYQQGDWHMPV